MKSSTIAALTLGAAVIGTTVCAAEIPSGTPVITAGTRVETPSWATKERELLDLNSKLVELSAKGTTFPNGYVNKTYTTSDSAALPHSVFTMMYKWPLIYALGGDDQVKDTWWNIWRAGMKQMTEAGFNTNEFLTAHDGNHMGQGYEGFFLAGLALPDDAEYKRLVTKFASFYDGENPEIQNYDPTTKTMKAVISGGAGPVDSQAKFNPKATNFWINDQSYAYEGPTNLIYTCFTTDAFLLTGDEKYRKFTVDYINAWKHRIEANHGVLPTKVNRDGTVAKDWWGGILGWDKPTARFGGLLVTMSGPNAAWSNALLLTGDPSYYDTYRRLADYLWAHRHIGEDGKVDTLPGWIDRSGPYGPSWEGIKNGPYASILANTYVASMSKADLDRVNSRSMLNGATGYNDWWEGGYEPDWFAFLQGKNADWPDKMLSDRIDRLKQELPAVEKAAEIGPKSDKPSSPGGGWCGPLVNLMTGAVMPRWQGQLLLGRFFYFDPEKKRTGITTDCAAMVDSMTADSATLTLVNTSQTAEHTVLVQSGAYAEHKIISVKPAGGPSVAVNGTLFAVKLAPGASERLTVSMKRYANKPKLKLPWQ